MNKVSILLPTRKRFDMAVNSINSLYNTCSSIDNFEILIALDNDDVETSNNLKDYFKDKNNIKLFYYERQFYRGLHNYYNDLCLNSSGSSLLLWNDDAIMRSMNWDLEILNNHKNFTVLNPKVDTMETYWREVGVLFPIIPKEWINITGKMSCVPSCDSWVDVISKRLNILLPLESVVISHERADVTGNNNDETFKDGFNDKFNPEFHSLFNVGFPHLLEEHYHKLNNHLNKQ
jgi:hypothetical protein